MDLESTYKAVFQDSLWEIVQSTQVIPYLFTHNDSYVCFLSMKWNTSKIGRGVLTGALNWRLEISDITVASVLFVDDVVWVLQSWLYCNLQYVVGLFAAECDAVRMRNGTSESEAVVQERWPVLSSSYPEKRLPGI